MRNARKIARKLRDDRLAKCIGRCEKPNEIKGFREVGVTNPSGFQDHLVMTASITLHVYFNLLNSKSDLGKRREQQERTNKNIQL